MNARLHGDCALMRAGGAGEELPHGTRCECRQLAAALGLRAESITYFYCRTTLQRHWCMTCRHGVIEPNPAPVAGGARWKHGGKTTPVLAILIRNS